MTNGLSESKIKWLTYLVYLLLVLGMAIVSRQQYQIGQIQETKVSKDRYLKDDEIRRERYSCDISRIEKNIDRVGSHLDKISDKIDKIAEAVK